MMQTKLAHLVTERAKQLSHAEGAVLECVTRKESVCLVAFGSLELLHNTRGPNEKSLSLACFQAGSSVICGDVAVDKRFDAARCRELSVRNILSIPQQWSAQELGVLTVVNSPTGFTVIDVHTLEVLMNLLSTSIVEVADEPAGVTLTELGESGYQQVLDAIADIVLVKGPRSRIVWGNKAFRDMYGMSNEELRGIIDSPASEPDHTQQYILDDKQVFETGSVLDIPNEPVTRHDGQVRSFHTVKSPIRDSEGKVVMTVGVGRDITERALLELNLRNAQKLEAIGRLAAGVAHEINTPLQYVMDSIAFARDSFIEMSSLVAHYRRALTQLAEGQNAAQVQAETSEQEERRDLGYLLENAPAAFDRSLDGIGRVATIVRAMKEFSHPGSEDMVEVDLNGAIASTLTMARSEYKQVATLETEFNTLPLVTCYPGEISQAVLNIVVNAAHAIEEKNRGSATMGLIRVCSELDGDHVVVRITDTGGGIPKDIQARIFDPFFTTKEVGRGTGQGLAIAHSVVHGKHGGELSFETELGQGTTFVLRLPVAGRSTLATASE